MEPLDFLIAPCVSKTESIELRKLKDILVSAFAAAFAANALHLESACSNFELCLQASTVVGAPALVREHFALPYTMTLGDIASREPAKFQMFFRVICEKACLAIALPPALSICAHLQAVDCSLEVLLCAIDFTCRFTSEPSARKVAYEILFGWLEHQRRADRDIFQASSFQQFQTTLCTGLTDNWSLAGCSAFPSILDHT
jgi:hypothetical protein